MDQLGAPGPEAARSRLLAHVGGMAAVGALLAYLAWRVGYTLPVDSSNRIAAWTLIGFEALPLAGLILKLITVWNIDSTAPLSVTQAPTALRVAVLIPTYNEPVEVLSPTVAAACALDPVHETWVLDDGDRDWVEQMCQAFGARYVRRPQHNHAKAGNLNNALRLIETDRDRAGVGIDIVAVLDCDHVPLPNFLTATLGWFADDDIALVQGPQAFYNSGAFDDDGVAGEQGLFFNVMMPARHHAGAGPFWCGSTSLLRVSALREIGGVATETITEDMHTTLKLIKAGWQTAYHHQTLAVGLAPATPEQYLVQRRRWGMGAMQILTYERLWAAKRWMSWRNFQEYLTGTLWWLEGIATLVAFIVPTTVMLSGAQTSTAPPLVFAAAFLAMFTTRMWGAKRLLRKQIHWPTAFALRIFRVPVGISCLWWLISRSSLQFQVTPKAGEQGRSRGRIPRILWTLTAMIAAVAGYSLAGIAGWVPWHTSDGSTAASGVWLALATVVLCLGTQRIRAAEFATSRRNGHRVGLHAQIHLNGVPAELIDISVGGMAVALPSPLLPPTGSVEVKLPGAEAVRMDVLTGPQQSKEGTTASLKVATGDWQAYRTIALWMFHTPPGAVPALPVGVPVVALR
ncbi:MAG TPA: glycosyltransferase [Jatrophihabitans sp.]